MTLLTRRAVAQAADGAAGGFGAAASTPPAAEVLALVGMNCRTLFSRQLHEGAKRAAAKARAELFIFDAEDSAAKQTEAIENFVRRRVKGIIVVAIDVAAVTPAVQEAAAAGIRVVAVDAILPPGRQRAQIGVRNSEAAGMLGRHFLDEVARSGGEARVGVIGALHSANQNLRRRGFEDMVSGRPGITVAPVVNGWDMADVAAAGAEALLREDAAVTALYATGEQALLGAIAAVEKTGKQEQVKIYGWDLTAQAIKAMDAGFVVAVAQQDPAAMGAAAVNMLATLDHGGSAPEIVPVPVTIVTKANVDPYRAVFA
jgi:ribose transport system substrate-binding protein